MRWKDGSHADQVHGVYKRDTVALVDSGITQKTVCKDLGTSKTALQTWVRDTKFQPHGLTPSTDPDERREMAAAIKRIRELEMENEVLRQLHEEDPRRRVSGTRR